VKELGLEVFQLPAFEPHEITFVEVVKVVLTEVIVEKVGLGVIFCIHLV